MTVTNVRLFENVQTVAANTIESIYTSPISGKGTLITNITASNDTAITRSYKAYLSSTTPTLATVPVRILIAAETDIPPELSGQFLPAGVSIWVETSAATSISFTGSGREIT